MRAKGSDSNWFAVTAGFSPKNFELAANRVERDISGLYPFKKILNFASKDLERCAPQTFAEFGSFLREDVPGYGYYSWKSEIINQVINGAFGECDGVVWVDAGCEIFNSVWTRKRFLNQITLAEQHGYLVFDLSLPEYKYSKADAIESFPSLPKDDKTAQVQATHFFLYGSTGRAIAKTWLEVGLTGIHMFDDSPSLNKEADDFVLHKSDQSLLSLTIKSLNANERMIAPPAGNRGFLSRISAIRAPIWTSRNRDGDSLKDPIIRLVERLTK
jgi:hypothetical protein